MIKNVNPSPETTMFLIYAWNCIHTSTQPSSNKCYIFHLTEILVSWFLLPLGRGSIVHMCILLLL
jgi:hypothetical protein